MSTDDVALCRPIRTRELLAHHCGKQVQLTNDEVKRADLLIRFLVSLGLGFQPGCPAAQIGQARLEFRLLDQPFGVAVDQPLDGAARLEHRTVKRTHIRRP